MDKPTFEIPGFGEVGIDTEASPGVGSYYVRLYDGSYDASGYDTEEEAKEELIGFASWSSDADGF